MLTLHTCILTLKMLKCNSVWVSIISTGLYDYYSSSNWHILIYHMFSGDRLLQLLKLTKFIHATFIFRAFHAQKCICQTLSWWTGGSFHKTSSRSRTLVSIYRPSGLSPPQPTPTPGYAGLYVARVHREYSKWLSVTSHDFFVVVFKTFKDHLCPFSITFQHQSLIPLTFQSWKIWL